MAFFKATYVQTDARSPDIEANSVGSCCICVGSGVQTVQQFSTMLGPAVHCGKDTSHKTLEIMRNAGAWPQQCWKSCANGSNTVALCSTITEQKKCCKLLTQEFDWF